MYIKAQTLTVRKRNVVVKNFDSFWQVMHDAHGEVVALGRFFQGMQLQFRINSVLDLALAHEALGGDARSSFGEVLWSFGLSGKPSRYDFKTTN